MSNEYKAGVLKVEVVGGNVGGGGGVSEERVNEMIMEVMESFAMTLMDMSEQIMWCMNEIDALNSRMQYVENIINNDGVATFKERIERLESFHN